MTISSTSSRPPSGNHIIASSSLTPQSSLQGSTNPPPYRLVFEPVTTSPCKQYQKNTDDRNCRNRTNRNFFSVAETFQGKGVLTRSALPPESSSCEVHPRNTDFVKGVVYMLHGWAQNVHVFSNRAKKLTKRLNKVGYKVVFLQGPHRLPPIAANSRSSNSAPATEKGRKIRDDSNDRKDSSSSPFSREYAYAWFLYDTPSNDSNSGSHSDENNHQGPLLQPSLEGDFLGMDTSLNFLRNELRMEREQICKTRTNDNDGAQASMPPFYLLGFSQGAVLVHKVATLAYLNRDTGDKCDFSDETDATGCELVMRSRPWADVQKCILVSGFSFGAKIRMKEGALACKASDSQDERNGSCQSCGYNASYRIMPSFHVVGKKDNRVSPNLTLELYSKEPCFGGTGGHKVLWEHDRGHVLPQDREFCDRLVEFLIGP